MPTPTLEHKEILLLAELSGLESKALTAEDFDDDGPIEGDGIVEAFVAVTGVRDKVGDIIIPGAFGRTLKELTPKICVGHDWNRPCGDTLAAEEWMPGDPRLPKLTADGKPWPAKAGVLWKRIQYDLSTKDGRRAYRNSRFFKGRTGWSIGYAPNLDKTYKAIDPDTGLPTRFLGELALWESSQVLHGAHPMALQQSVKAIPAPVETKAIRRVGDSAYWGYPVGTPIVPGMRPRGVNARRQRQNGRVPSRDVGVTVDAPDADGKLKGTRAKPDTLAAQADETALIGEGDLDLSARVRATAKASGQDEKYVADIALSIANARDMRDPDEAEAERATAGKPMQSLLTEGITPDELREDLENLANNPRNDSAVELDADEIDEIVEDYTGRYNALAKRQARERGGQAEPEGEAPVIDTPEGEPAAEAADVVPVEDGGYTATGDVRDPASFTDEQLAVEIEGARAKVADLRAKRVPTGSVAMNDARIAVKIFEDEQRKRAKNPATAPEAVEPGSDAAPEVVDTPAAAPAAPTPRLTAQGRGLLADAYENRAGQLVTSAHENTAYPLIKAGLLKPGSSPGIYNLTDAGRAARDGLGEDTAPPRPDRTTPAMWRNPDRAADRLTGPRRADYMALDGQGKSTYAVARARGDDHDTALTAAGGGSGDTATDAPEIVDAPAPVDTPQPQEIPAEADPVPDDGYNTMTDEDLAAALDMAESNREFVESMDNPRMLETFNADVEGMRAEQARRQETPAATAPEPEPAVEESAPDVEPALITPPPPVGEISTDRLVGLGSMGGREAIAAMERSELERHDAELTRRATALGKPGVVTPVHQAVKKALAAKPVDEPPAAVDDPIEDDGPLPRVPDATGRYIDDLGEVVDGGEGFDAEQVTADTLAQAEQLRGLEDDELDIEATRLDDIIAGLSADGVQPYDPAMLDAVTRRRAVDTVRAERENGDTDGPDLASLTDPEVAAALNADDEAEAQSVADAAHGVTEAPDGAIEVEPDIAERQDRVAALLAAGDNLDLGARDNDQLRADRTDLVEEIRLQTYLDTRTRADRAQAAARRRDAARQGDTGETTATAEPEEDTGPKPRPGVAGAAEDLADAFDSGDPDRITATRARLDASLARTRVESDAVTALRALLDGDTDPTPEQLRAVADSIRVEARDRRNRQARIRRAARRFERDRLIGALVRVESEMTGRGMDFDPTPDVDGGGEPDAPTVVSGATWSTRADGDGFRIVDVHEVSGSHYTASVTKRGREATYKWEVTDDNGGTIASGLGTAATVDNARAAVAISLGAQYTAGKLPVDAQLPDIGDLVTSSQRPSEDIAAAVTAMRGRLTQDERRINPVTGEPDPFAPPTVRARPSAPVFDNVDDVRKHQTARAAKRDDTERQLANIARTRWDDYKLTPGGGLAVGTFVGESGARIMHPVSGTYMALTVGRGGKYPTLARADLARLAEIIETLPDSKGHVVDWSLDQGPVADSLRKWTDDEGNSGYTALIEAGYLQLLGEKVKTGKWSSAIIRDGDVTLSGMGNPTVTNPSRHHQVRTLRNSLTSLLATGTGGKVDADGKETMAQVRGASLLDSLGAPDAAAVLLRRRAAELRDKYGENGARDRGAWTLDQMATAHLSSYSPAAAPGERVQNLRQGERVTFAGDGEDAPPRTFRALSDMRSRGVYGGSEANVVEESTGKTFKISVSNAFGGEELSVSDSLGGYPKQKASLGSDTFVVTGIDETVPLTNDDVRTASVADAGLIPDDVLDAAAQALPESGPETAQRRAAAEPGQRPPRRNSPAAPRRSAAPPAPVAPVPGEQHLANAQGARRARFLGDGFVLADTAPPGGFTSIDEALDHARELLAEMGPLVSNNPEYRMLQFMTSSPDYTEAGGAKLSPGGHLVVTKAGVVAHARSSGAVWGIGGEQMMDGGYQETNQAVALAVADHLERGTFGGAHIDWTQRAGALQRQVVGIRQAGVAQAASGDGAVDHPSTIAARSAHAALVRDAKTPTARAVNNLDAMTSAATSGDLTGMANPDALLAFDAPALAQTYSVLGGTKAGGKGTWLADSKTGSTLAKRVALELRAASALSRVTPLDAVRRLNRVADDLDGQTITGKGSSAARFGPEEKTPDREFVPSDDLRAMAKAITDAFDEEKPSPLGRLRRADSEGVVRPDKPVTVISAPLYGAPNAQTAVYQNQVAQGYTDRINAADGGAITFFRDAEGHLHARLGGREVDTGKSGGTERITFKDDGGIVIHWTEPVNKYRMELEIPAGGWQFEEAGSPDVAGTGAVDTPEVDAPDPGAPDLPDAGGGDTPEGKVRAAVAALEKEPEGWVSLRELRESLPDLTREEVDAVLYDLAVTPGVHLVPEANEDILTPADREAAFRDGGQDNHLIAIEDRSGD